MRKTSITGLNRTFSSTSFERKRLAVKGYIEIPRTELVVGDCRPRKVKSEISRRTNPSSWKDFGDRRHEALCHLRASAVKSKEQLIQHVCSVFLLVSKQLYYF